MLSYYNYNKYQKTIYHKITTCSTHMANLNESLLSYLIYDEKIDGESSSHIARHRQYQILFYLIGLMLAEGTWIGLSVTYYQPGHEVSFMLLFGIVWVLAWAVFGLKKSYMFISQFLFWIQACYHSLMYALAMLIHNHNFILCGSSMGIIFFIILELCLRKKVVSTKFFLYLYLWYVVVLYDDMKKLQYAAKSSWLTMIMLDLYLLFGIVVYILIVKKWKGYSKFAKWQVICLAYPLSILFVICFAGSFPEREFHFKWVWLTFINHAVFVGICGVLFVKNRSLLPCKCKRKQVGLLESEEDDDPRQKLYQVSDTYLEKDQDHIKYPRESMQGTPPLCNCLFCMDQPSTFCYANCRHACLGINCTLDLLKNDRKQCPICRVKSNAIFQIERVVGLQFAINAKYKFKSP